MTVKILSSQDAYRVFLCIVYETASVSLWRYP